MRCRDKKVLRLTKQAQDAIMKTERALPQVVRPIQCHKILLMLTVWLQPSGQHAFIQRISDHRSFYLSTLRSKAKSLPCGKAFSIAKFDKFCYNQRVLSKGPERCVVTNNSGWLLSPRKFLFGRGWGWNGKVSFEISRACGHFGPGAFHKSMLTAWGPAKRSALLNNNVIKPKS